MNVWKLLSLLRSVSISLVLDPYCIAYDYWLWPILMTYLFVSLPVLGLVVLWSIYYSWRISFSDAILLLDLQHPPGPSVRYRGNRLLYCTLLRWIKPTYNLAFSPQDRRIFPHTRNSNQRTGLKNHLAIDVSSLQPTSLLAVSIQ